MFYYRKTKAHFNRFDIGIYDKREKAEKALDNLKNKAGFCDYPKGFKIRRVFRFKAPRLLNKTYWEDGFITLKY